MRHACGEIRWRWVYVRVLATFLVAASLLLCGASARGGVSVLHSFDASSGEGYNPLGTLLLSGSTLYGMTNFGGRLDEGTLFAMQADGTGFKTLHNFNDGSVPDDGRFPQFAALIQSGSSLYGMTPGGGTLTGGTIFRIGTEGAGYQILHSFSFFDGQAPYGSLHLSGSSLYGMTAVSGANGVGTIFEVATDGSGFKVLHDFEGGAAGAYPHGSLIQSGSTLYGMTTGIQEGAVSGLGTIFRIDSDGTGFQTLHAFAALDGLAPDGSLVLDGSTLYGMTVTGGREGGTGRGTIFRMAIDGTRFQVMHAFDPDKPEEGLNPHGSLLLLGDKLYGMVSNADGGGGAGTIFEIGTDGTGFRTLHAFGGADGVYPYGALVQSGQTLYGMTGAGGDFAEGTIFNIQVPEPSGLAVAGIAVYGLLRRRRRTFNGVGARGAQQKENAMMRSNGSANLAVSRTEICERFEQTVEH